jgi:hypothetical protein
MCVLFPTFSCIFYRSNPLFIRFFLHLSSLLSTGLSSRFLSWTASIELSIGPKCCGFIFAALSQRHSGMCTLASYISVHGVAATSVCTAQQTVPFLFIAFRKLIGKLIHDYPSCHANQPRPVLESHQYKLMRSTWSPPKGDPSV